MTYQEIQNEVVDLLGPAGGRDFTRAGRAINRRYRWALSSVGLPATVRTTISATTTISDRLLTFANCAKIFAVFNPSLTEGPGRVLREITFDEMRNRRLGLDPPREYAIQRMGADTVVIMLSTEPATEFSLTADGEAPASLLATTDEPAFPQDFHDLLVDGALAMLLEAKGQYDPASVHEARFQQRLGELRFFIAKSAYLHLHQGKTSTTRMS